MTAARSERPDTRVLPRPDSKGHPALRPDPRPRSRAEGIVEAIQAWLDGQL